MSPRRNPTRRDFIATSGVALGVSVAGCATGDDAADETPSEAAPGGTESTPEGTEQGRGNELPTASAQELPLVHIPAHQDGMRMVGMAEVGPYMVAMSYTLLHDFWILTGKEKSYVQIEDGQGLHLMATVWDPEYNQRIPLGSPPVEVRDAASGDSVTEKSLWPMLSQQMGPHFGDNVAFPEEGEYTVQLSFDPVSARQLGEYRGRFTDAVDAEFDLLFRTDITNNIRERFVDEAGQAGALEPMETDMQPDGRLADAASLPGEHGGIIESGAAEFVVQVLRRAPAGIDSSGPYLAVSARTPYNQYPLPFMGLRATVANAGEEVREPLKAAIHPELGYHYGAPFPAIAMGDDVTLSVGAPPQVARHRGYQTAFLEFDDTTLTLGDGT
ncbi:iron transporter [Haloarcula hispanica]|uniref:iron transporter n=1 Tax=Haloarcula hispanica TaxID=51589 RepID=UPI0021BD6475|nr:iron transporter [Haloarcula hispanica]